MHVRSGRNDPAGARRCVMAIDGGLRDKLQPGTRLWARYRGAEFVAEVMVGEDDKRRYRLEDGREFKSLSAAGSAVMGGIACKRLALLECRRDSGEARTKRSGGETPEQHQWQGHP